MRGLPTLGLEIFIDYFYQGPTITSVWWCGPKKRVSLGKQIEEWSLTFVEQIPGLVASSDQSQLSAVSWLGVFL